MRPHCRRRGILAGSATGAQNPWLRQATLNPKPLAAVRGLLLLLAGSAGMACGVCPPLWLLAASFRACDCRYSGAVHSCVGWRN
jgi:hypothetical protein